ncbi:metalloprotein, YbeY/UPF0054 family [Thioflavicoccus mobilis 8321]|uniref:Endoribonuclease YbeY n=1 Tax=Thioflavicoccus mobilis 8321 TaxID=765912 RepID=L0GRZ2_9GAMM|nr:rRNA maturation RNase YbeY [Thioflavicoccus mobilis]AGA89508.1 metalloprotein, YbeY/UPF0054 family [Thioflavicoccus mobilis 8321]
MNLRLDLQCATAAQGLPTAADCAAWITAALAGRRARAEVTVRLVDLAEGTELNRDYRGKDGPTNILSFQFEAPPGLTAETDLLGDLVICAPLVAREAAEQGKAPAAHWAHLLIHGTLHLIGYDHADEAAAAEMEGLETVILRGLGFDDPYNEINSTNDKRSI